jgi:DNA polymerase alpha subunit p180 N terminal
MPYSKRAAALRAMREAREKSDQGLLDKLDEYQEKDNGDVYEVVDEEDYQKLVESRRQREDFVVDDGASWIMCCLMQILQCLTSEWQYNFDTKTMTFLSTALDGLGCNNDGEERLGDETESEQRSKRRTGFTANITAAALKRARKTKALLAKKKKSQDDTFTDVAPKNASMWEFFQGGATVNTSTLNKSRANVSNNMGNLDSLMDTLDANDVVSKKSASSSRLQ